LNKTILHKSVDLLSRREHSRKELQQKLLQREYLAEEISEVINYLVDNNYLSDERYSESVFRLRVNKGFGKYYIEQELRQKGISNSLITALEQQQMIDWTAQAAVAYQKKYADITIKDQKEKAKRIRFLQSRGFSTDEILTVINKISLIE
jgi:regulatory protein